MKQTLNNTFVGQILKASIEEVLSSKDFIVSFNGDLIRVSNKTGKPFKQGDRVELVVLSVRPISFKLNSGKRKAAGLNVSV